MIKAVIFDVDGVLIDSLEANIAIVQKLLVAMGYSKPTREQVLEHHHAPILLTFRYLSGTNDSGEMQRARKMIESGLNTEVRDLVRFPEKLDDYLTELHGKYKLAIATSRLRRGMDDVFSLRDMTHFFDAVITYDDVKNPKPHPEPLLMAAERLNVTPQEAIYIGDGPSDIVASKAAGMKSIHISRSPHPDAHKVIEEFSQLLEAIESLL